jgi:hypothetical protein
MIDAPASAINTATAIRVPFMRFIPASNDDFTALATRRSQERRILTLSLV